MSFEDFGSIDTDDELESLTTVNVLDEEDEHDSPKKLDLDNEQEIDEDDVEDPYDDKDDDF